MYIHEVNDVGQTGIHADEPLVFELNPCEIDIFMNVWKSYKSPGTDRITADWIQRGDKILCYDVYKHTIGGL